MKCKWDEDDVCVNYECPYCADYCPLIMFPDVCKYYDKELENE